MSSEESEQTYTRSRHRFFGRSDVKRAVVEIANADSLIIYCGAGVTIDRTGLAWRDLISKLLVQELTPPDDPQDIQPDERAALLAHAFTPLEMASSLKIAEFPQSSGSENTEKRTRRRLGTLLYDDSGWQAGALASAIVKLAVTQGRIGKSVVLLTTNYDSYIEEGFKEFISEANEKASKTGVSLDRPGLTLSSPWLAGAPLERFKAVGAGMGTVDLIYLHGRVAADDEEQLACPLMISEADYHLNYTILSDFLRKLFDRKDTSLLIVGSSLSDPPLLSALTNTRGRGARYALFPAPSTGQISLKHSEFSALKEHYRTRGEHFGIELLIPDFYYQSAQFCQEVVTCLEVSPAAGGAALYHQKNSEISYGQRLVAWWQRWNTIDEKRGPQDTYNELARCLEEIREQLSARLSDYDTGTEPEWFKLEFWVRCDPESERTLSLWASSSGILLDKTTRRKEELKLNSHNASIRAFIAGQPQYVSREELVKYADLPPVQGQHIRWRSYLSVPIRIESSPHATLDIPVGVLTLATMRPKTASDPAMKSAIPHKNNNAMQRLISLMNELGERLLGA